MEDWFENFPLGSTFNGLKSLCCGWLEINARNIVIITSTLAVFYGIFLRKLSDVKKEDYKIRPRVKVDAPYDGEECEPLTNLKDIPIISGWLKSKIIRLISNTYFKSFMTTRLLRKVKRDVFRTIIFPEEPTFLPLVKGDPCLYEKKPINEKDLWNLIKGRLDTNTDGRFEFVSISDLMLLYREGKKTPETVMKTLVRCLKESEKQTPPLRSFIEYYEDKIMEQAIASTKRWKEGKALSVFDGIPVGVKDEFIVGDHHMRNGCSLDVDGEKLNISDERGLVKKLRAGGAIIIGMTNMHQCGLGVTGINQSKLHGTARNPYNVHYSTGGSSSGSACAVASGLSVVGIGGDGGGSIRIPAACCGIVGLKATYGAYSNAGKKRNSFTVGHTGALCSTMTDMAITYGFLAGKDECFPAGLVQPPICLGDFQSLDLSGLKVGVDRLLMKEALPEIQAGCENALKWLKEIYHVEVVDIHIPEKFEVSVAHSSTILAEMVSNNSMLQEVYYDDINSDTLSLLEAGKRVQAFDYLQSAKQRTRSINALKYIFSQVDFILTPGFNCFQPEVTPSMEKYGYYDVMLTTNIMGPHVIMNLTGVPAITLPVGYSNNNLPVAVQLISSWWREDILFKVGYALERCVKSKAPQVYFDISN